MKKLMSTEERLHRESMAQLGLHLPPAPPQGHIHFGHLPSSVCVFSSHGPFVREGQDRPLSVTVGMSRNCQGSDSSRVIEGHRAGPGKEPEVQGHRAHLAPLSSSSPSLAIRLGEGELT